MQSRLLVNHSSNSYIKYEEEHPELKERTVFRAIKMWLNSEKKQLEIVSNTHEEYEEIKKNYTDATSFAQSLATTGKPIDELDAEILEYEEDSTSRMERIRQLRKNNREDYLTTVYTT
ncbi:MAG: hypothetical protein ABEI78_00900, partial [Candidatus Nanohaloarchaea archaeon]